MTIPPSQDRLLSRVRELLRAPQETDWLEFKVNYDAPEDIGEYISALSNGAALAGRNHGYLLWGIDDVSHDVVGTRFSPTRAKKGAEPLQNWLHRLLTPSVDFAFRELVVDGSKLVLLIVPKASHRPIAFRGRRYVRAGAAKKPLDAYPEKERALWRLFDQVAFERQIAAEGLSAKDVLGALDYPRHFHLLGRPPPDGADAIVAALAEDSIVARSEAGGFDVTNLGAMLLAKDLADFPRLRRKALRVIHYSGAGRLHAVAEHEFTEGYAAGFDKIALHVVARLPAKEEFDGVYLRPTTSFPEVAVRELIANALIHQDFSHAGAGPMVEVFEGRLEISNPGEPLVDTQRFVDAPPTSRNEVLASLMRRFRLCEERGSGIDRVLSEIEQRQLPAPLFEATPRATRVVLFDRKSLAEMDGQERLRACYLHACLQFVTGRRTTNGSLRERLGVLEKNASMVSRILGDAVDAGLIVVANPENGLRSRHYVPFWARPGGS